jgi:hypothetical protein
VAAAKVALVVDEQNGLQGGLAAQEFGPEKPASQIDQFLHIVTLFS